VSEGTFHAVAAEASVEQLRDLLATMDAQRAFYREAGFTDAAKA
jgi:hypothetical protein